MYRWNCLLLVCATALLLSACSQPASEPASVVVKKPATVTKKPAPAVDPSGVSISLSDDLMPPRSSSRVKLQKAVEIVITRKALVVENSVMAAVKDGEVDCSVKRDGCSGYLITPLLTALQKHAVRLKKIDQMSKGKVSFEGVVVVIAHRDTSYRLLSEVLYTAGQAEFGHYRVASLCQGTGLRLCMIPVKAPTCCRSGRPSAPGAARPLHLTVAISYKGHMVAGSGGVLTGPNGSNIAVPCKRLVDRRCAWPMKTRSSKDPAAWSWHDAYDYSKLGAMLKEIKGKHAHDRQVIVTADRHVPLQAVVKTLDALRGAPSLTCSGTDGCLFDRVILSAGVQ